MKKRKVLPVTIHDAHIIFRNFQGRAGDFNKEGERSFTVVLPEEIAKAMIEDGWTTVKERQAYGEEPGVMEYRMDVTVQYDKGRPPRCVLINSNGRLELGAAEVAVLDFVEIEHVDLTLNPYEWDVQGKQGVKPYLKTIFVKAVEDELDKKYAQVPEAHPALNNNFYDDDDEALSA